jgi:hypothetical protein
VTTFNVYVQLDGALVLIRAAGVPVKIRALDWQAALTVALASYPRHRVAVGAVS